MKKAVLYSICVCLFSWAAFGLVWVTILKDQPSNGLWLRGMEVIYMFFPMWIVAVAIPFAVLLLAVPISALMPGAQLHYGPEGIIAFSGLEGEAADAVISQFSAISGATLFLIRGGSDLTVGMSGLAGFIATVIVIAIIWLYDRKHGRIMGKEITI